MQIYNAVAYRQGTQGKERQKFATLSGKFFAVCGIFYIPRNKS